NLARPWNSSPPIGQQDQTRRVADGVRRRRVGREGTLLPQQTDQHRESNRDPPRVHRTELFEQVFVVLRTGQAHVADQIVRRRELRRGRYHFRPPFDDV